MVSVVAYDVLDGHGGVGAVCQEQSRHLGAILHAGVVERGPAPQCSQAAAHQHWLATPHGEEEWSRGTGWC